MKKIIWFINAVLIRIYSAIARHLIGKCGKGVLFCSVPHIDNGERICIGNIVYFAREARLSCWGEGTISIGSNCHFGERVFVTSSNQINIGDNLLTGNNVLISDNSHGDTDFDTLNIPPYERPILSKGPVKIGNNVWLGQNVCILSGVEIGDGAVIAANAVVTRDIPAYCVAAGIPAKVVKKTNEQ